MNFGRRADQAVGHRAAHRLLGPAGVRDDQRPRGVPVTRLERADDVDVVLCAQRVTPRRVAQHLAHPALHAERLIRLQQMVVAGQGEQVVVERRVGLGVLRGVDEVVLHDVGQRRFGQQAVAGQLPAGQSAQGELQGAEFECLTRLEDRVGLVDLGVLLADLVAVFGHGTDAVGAVSGTGAGKSVWPASVRAPHGSRAPSSSSSGPAAPSCGGCHHLAGDAAGHVSRLGVLHRLGPRVNVLVRQHHLAGDRAGIGGGQQILGHRAGGDAGLGCRGVRLGRRATVRERELLVVETGRFDAGAGDVAAHRLHHGRRPAQVDGDVAVVEVCGPDQCHHPALVGGPGGGIGHAVLPA